MSELRHDTAALSKITFQVPPFHAYREREREMPLNGVWSGRGGDVRVTTVYAYHFPEDKENRDPVHARLAKKIAAREAQKAAGHGQKGN